MKDIKSGKKSENKDDDDRYSWRKYCGAGYFYNVYPENYKTYDDYELALMREIHARGDEDKFVRKSGNTAGNTASGQNTGFTGNTTPRQSNTGRKTASGQNIGAGKDTDAVRNTGSSGNPGSAVTGTEKRKRVKLGARVVEGPFTFNEIPGGLTLSWYQQEEGVSEIVIPGNVGGRKVLSVRGLFSELNMEIERVTMSEGIEEIAPMAFHGCWGLREVVFPSTLREIQGSAFDNCMRLTELRFPEGLREIGSCAFAWCTGLKSVYIPESVEEIGNHNFFGKYASKDVTIYCPAGSYAWEFAERHHIPHEEPGPGAFKVHGDTEPEPETEEEKPGKEESSFLYGTAGQKEGAPAASEAAGKRDTMQSAGAADGSFTFCEIPGGLELCRYHHVEGTTELVIPGSAEGKKVLSIAGLAFKDETELERVTVSEGIGEIGGMAFKGCRALKEVILPSSLKEIGANAFEDCTSLTEIRLPQGVREIDSCTFLRCTSLKKVYIPDSVENIESNNFSGKYASRDVTIYCHAGSYAWEYAERNHIPHKEPGAM